MILPAKTHEASTVVVLTCHFSHRRVELPSMKGGDGVLDTTGAVVSSTGPIVSGVANTVATAVSGAGRTVQDAAATVPVY